MSAVQALLAIALWLGGSAVMTLLCLWLAYRRYKSSVPATLELVPPEVRRRLPYQVAMTSEAGVVPISQHATPREAVQALGIVAANFRAQDWEVTFIDETTYRMRIRCDWGYKESRLEIIPDADVFNQTLDDWRKRDAVPVPDDWHPLRRETQPSQLHTVN